MQKILSLLLCLLFLTGCSTNTITEVTATHPGPQAPLPSEPRTSPAAPPDAPEYVSRFDSVTDIFLTDEGITVNGNGETNTVYTSRDIIYYEDRVHYASGNPYGEGADTDRHTAQEADAHIVVNITAPGAYRLTGSLSSGQIRVDLGENAENDPNAVVELILSDTDISCTVAPAILFLSTYECDRNWSAETANAHVDTAAAGANLILEGSNVVNGSYVARIYQDQEGEKKLWKQDGAIYSYQSLNVFGPGSLNLTASNEGLDTELHLTINGGDIRICADNDGINTNEDGVSVTTINGGNLTIFAGLGDEGDGIDSNGYLVINGGTVLACANPGADAGLDSDLGSYINGGSVTALGAAMDWAESNSSQVTMNLQFAAPQTSGAQVTITSSDGTEVCTFRLEEEHTRSFRGLILSRSAFVQGETYHIFVDGVQMAFTGTDVRRGPGGPGPDRPDGFGPENRPDDFDPSGENGRPGPRQDDFPGGPPDFPDSVRPVPPADDLEDSRPDRMPEGEPSTSFYMNDMVNFFSGIAPAA